MAESSKVTIDWSFRNLDDNNRLIKPQFPMPESGVSISVGGQLAQQARFGEQDPITHWTGGKARTFTFNAVLYARHRDEAQDVEALLDALIGLSVKDEVLGRTPICLFRYGQFLSETVLVESVDPQVVSVDPLYGAPREVRLAITLHKYKPFNQKTVDPTKPVKESFLRIASEAELSYEAIAKRHYGDPLLGDRLRKRHPANPHAAAIGQLVHVPPRAVVLQETVKPSFHALSLTDDAAVDAYEAILAARTARKLVVAR